MSRGRCGIGSAPQTQASDSCAAYRWPDGRLIGLSPAREKILTRLNDGQNVHPGDIS